MRLPLLPLTSEGGELSLQRLLLSVRERRFRFVVVFSVLLHLVLHDMLVAGSAPITKGGRQNRPLPCRAFRAEQNSATLPFSALLRLRCVQVVAPAF